MSPAAKAWPSSGCWGRAFVSHICCDLFGRVSNVGNLCFHGGESHPYTLKHCCGPGRNAFLPGLSDWATAADRVLPTSCDEPSFDTRPLFNFVTARDDARLPVFSYAMILYEARLLLERQVASPTLLLLLGILNRLWPFAMHACAPVAWLGFLLAAEQQAHLEPNVSRSMLGLASRAASTVDASDASATERLAWTFATLQLERVARLLRQSADAQQFRPRLGLGGKQDVDLDVVIIACSSSREDLRHLRALTRDRFPAVSSGRLLLYDVCRPFSQHYRRFVPFELVAIPAEELNPVRDASVGFAQAFGVVRVFGFDEDVQTAGIGATFAHFAAFYDDLAEVTLVLHADFTEHVLEPLLSRVWQMRSWQGHWPSELEFLYLSWYHLPYESAADQGEHVGSALRCFCEEVDVAEGYSGMEQRTRRLRTKTRACAGGYARLDCQFLERLWPVVFSRALGVADDVGGYANSQFAVRRTAVRRNAKGYYWRVSQELGSRRLWAPYPSAPWLRGTTSKSEEE